VSEESRTIQEIPRHRATLFTRIGSLLASVNEINVSMEELTEGRAACWA
jgi:hypothetical protein